MREGTKRELLDVVFWLDKFRTYFSGVVVYSDDETLLKIQLKCMSDAPLIVKDMLLKIQPYDTELRYRLGK